MDLDFERHNHRSERDGLIEDVPAVHPFSEEENETGDHAAEMI
jgi:hypothetical protein